MARVKPYLSATRVSRVVPMTRSPPGPPLRVESGSRQAYRTVSPTKSRIRYARLQIHLSRPSVMASLDFEVTPLAACDMALEELSLILEDGEVQPLVAPGQESLPVTCRFGDASAFIYRLSLPRPVGSDVQRYSKFKILEIHMRLRALLSEGCRPLITMKWRTSVDFSIASRVSSSVRVQPHASLEPGSNQPVPVLESPAASESGPDAHATSTPSGGDEKLALIRRAEQAQWSGVTITVAGPAEVRVGEVFNWRVFVVNRSPTQKELALLVLPRRRRVTESIERQPPANGKEAGFAEAVVDDKALFNMQRAASMDPADVVCLSTDIRLQ